MDLPKKIKNYEYVFVALTLNILFFYPTIFSNKTFFFRDIHRWFYPMKYFLAKSLKSGSIPFWSSHYFCGSPFMSDLQSGVFYPISLVFVLFPFPWSFNIYIILHFFLAFCFFYHFIKGLGLTKKAALITSISYCYGGYTIASVNVLNNLSTLIWLPAILWSFHRAADGNYKSGYFFTVLFLCMAILGGEPQLFLLISGLLLFFGLTSSPRKTPKIRSHIKNTVIILLLIASAVLLMMFQLGPAYQDYQLSVRLGGLTYEEAVRHSLDLGMLKHFIIPLRFPSDFTTDPATLNRFFPGQVQAPWLLTVYPGLMLAPMALIGLFFNFSRKILLWIVTFTITLVLALGGGTPIYYIFFKIFPIFRFPEKFIVLTNFSLLVLSAYGLDRLLSFIRQRGIRPNLLFWPFVLILIIDLFTAHRNLNPLYESTFYHYSHPYLKPILDDPETFRVYVDPETTAPKPFEETILNDHIKWQAHLMPNIGMLLGLNHVGGTTGLELRYQYLITKILLRPWETKLRFLKLANVKYIISSQNLVDKPGMKGHVEKINPVVYRINDYLPRAWVVGQLHTIKKGVIDELINGSFNPTSSALAKGKIVDRYTKPYFREVGNLSYEPDGRIHVELTAEAPGILVVSESSYPGWRVFVDGQEKENLWLNLLFQGVEIDKGKHRIDFIYRPKGFLWFSIDFFQRNGLFLYDLVLLLVIISKKKFS